MVDQRDTPEQHAKDARDLRVCEMLDAGHTYAEIRAETGASPSQISALAAVLREEAF
jgi:uncharacterized protein YerC